MIKKINLENIFDDLKDYNKYYQKYNIGKIFNINSINKDSFKKRKFPPYFSVTPNIKEPYPIELDDLIRLHYLVIKRKVCTILEFGLGYSTAIFDNALEINKIKYSKKVKNLRRSNLFECHSVDNYKIWINSFKKRFTTKNVQLHFSKLQTSTFKDVICTYYSQIPNISPDLIYVDGPDQFSAKGSIRGISTNHPDRMPMIGDILAMENFLLPGTMIIVDGRTSNARFMKNNFQRNWIYHHFVNFDQHVFELNEEPLGILNRNQIDICLGKEYYQRSIRKALKKN